MEKTETENPLRKFGKWLDELIPDQRLRLNGSKLLGALGCLEDGSGVLPVLELCADAMSCHAAVEEFETPRDWGKFIANMVEYGQYSTDARVHEPYELDKQVPAWGHLCTLAKAHARARLPVSALVALSILILEALRQGGSISEAATADLQTLCGSQDRTGAHIDWHHFRSLKRLDIKALEDVAKKVQSASVQGLVRRLMAAVSSAESVPSPTAEANRPEQERKADRKLTPPDLGTDKVKEGREDVAPTVRSVKRAAAFAGMAEAFGVEWAWDVLPPEHFKENATGLTTALQGDDKHKRGLALLCSMSAFFGRSLKPTFRLSLKKNGDIWYCPESRCGFYNRRLLLGLKGADLGDDLVPIFVSEHAADELAERLAEHPGAIELSELILDGDAQDFLREAEALCRSLGDPAHAATSGRISNSLPLVYIHRGATPQVASMLTGKLACSADSALNYLRLESEDAIQLATDAMEWLGLGPIAKPRGLGPIGSREAPTLEEAVEDCRKLRGQAETQCRTVEADPSLPELLDAFNSASAADAMLMGWGAGGTRPQRFDRLSHGDVRGSSDFVFVDDEATKVESARLIPRTVIIDDVVSRQLYTREKTVERLLALGFQPKAIPSLLHSPQQRSPFFIELYLNTRRGRGRLCARPLRAERLAKVKRAREWMMTNASRHFWCSAAGLSKTPMLEPVLTGHTRGLAGAGSPCLGQSVMTLLGGVKSFVNRPGNRGGQLVQVRRSRSDQRVVDGNWLRTQPAARDPAGPSGGDD